MTADNEKKEKVLIDNEEVFPDHVPLVPLDTKRANEKEQIRKLAEEIRKKSAKIEPIIVTSNGVVKRASELTLSEKEYEFVRCATNPIYFIETYLTIFDQTQGKAGLIVPFKLFDFQKTLVQTYVDERFTIANKYRQAGISTTTCAYIAWYVMFNENRSVAIVADKLETARDEIMNDVVLFIEGCPEWLRPKTGKEAFDKFKDTQKLKRYDNGSSLGAFSSKGLRGYTPTLLFWDETAWTEKADKFWTSAKPTLQTGGAAIMVSTPSGLDAVFYKTFDGARKPEGDSLKNNFKAVELWWFNDPRYNKGLVWLKNKGKETQKTWVDENWSNEKRIELQDEGWEASSPWFEEQVRDANGDMRKIAQELMCVNFDSKLKIRNKNTGIVEEITISDFYDRLNEQKNSCEYLYKNTILMDKNILIKLLRTIENVNQYYIKGGTSKFNKDYPNILNLINVYSSEMQIYSSNKILEAKIKYLISYDGDINKITMNGNILIFDKYLKQFKIANINSAKKQWKSCNDELNNINELYDENTTKELLKDSYLNYFGKSGNRKLLRDNKKLFLSLYSHTKEFDLLEKNLNKLSFRLHFFVNNINTYCEKHNYPKHWKLVDGNVVVVCSKCNPKYPSKEWYVEKYSNDWKFYSDERKKHLSELKTNGKEWHIKKYGNIVGNAKYCETVVQRINNISKLKGNKFSKISQELFWKLHESLNDKTDTYFHDLNKEYVIRIPNKYNHENVVMLLDFKHKNKIIEYNGNYWHNSKKDNIRYSILREMGYEIFVVTSNEFNKNKKPKEIIDKCLKFLTC
jgi:hypothetical protein